VVCMDDIGLLVVGVVLDFIVLDLCERLVCIW